MNILRVFNLTGASLLTGDKPVEGYSSAQRLRYTMEDAYGAVTLVLTVNSPTQSVYFAISAATSLLCCLCCYSAMYGGLETW